MKKRIQSIALLAIVFAALAACGGTQSLSGLYTDASGSVTYVFNSDEGLAYMLAMGDFLELGEYEVKDRDVYIGGTKAGTVKGKVATLYSVEFRKTE
jgi:hypothetical protein